MGYNGGKNGSGVYQKIISMMPPHDAYFEMFLGHGAILLNKKPATENFGVEIDGSLADFWAQNKNAATDIIFADAFDFLQKRKFRTTDLIYLDPPYLKSTRRNKRPIYNFEMMSDAEHIKLLNIILELKCMVMISGYESELYNDYLNSWRKESFQTTDRANNLRTETVWLNFPKTIQLHDYSFLGTNWRERDRIKQKRKRWKQRLLKMNEQEMFSLMATIEELKAEVS
jgi:DNA adenine methylase